jgi:hypothetical protein
MSNEGHSKLSKYIEDDLQPSTSTFSPFASTNDLNTSTASSNSLIQVTKQEHDNLREALTKYADDMKILICKNNQLEFENDNLQRQNNKYAIDIKYLN